MDGLIANVEAVSDSAQPVNEALPLDQITLVWLKALHCLERVGMHPSDCVAQGHLGFEFLAIFSYRLQESSIRL